jgi:Zn-dependent protease with chaperone function
MMKHTFVYQLVFAFLISIQPFWFSQAHAEDREVAVFPGNVNNTAAIPNNINGNEINNSGVTEVYSDLEMKFDLAIKDNAAPCEKFECQESKAFDKRVQSLGKRLATTAYKKHPDLEERVKTFQFSVVDKIEAGTASNAKGNIVIFRGLQHLKLSDKAIRFLIGREMGHVIAKHHNKNTTAKLIISAIVAAVVPVAGIVSVTASTATTYVGGKVVMLKVKPKQLAEADNIALDLLGTKRSGIRVVMNALPKGEATTSWSKDLQMSKNNLALKLQRRPVAIAQSSPLK